MSRVSKGQYRQKIRERDAVMVRMYRDVFAALGWIEHEDPDTDQVITRGTWEDAVAEIARLRLPWYKRVWARLTTRSSRPSGMSRESVK